MPLDHRPTADQRASGEAPVGPDAPGPDAPGPDAPRPDAPGVPGLAVFHGEERFQGTSATERTAQPGFQDATEAFVLCSFSTTESEGRERPTCQLDGKKVVVRVGNDEARTRVVWQVVRWPGARVQRGALSFKAPDQKRTATVAPVDPKRSLLIVTARGDAQNGEHAFDERFNLRGRLLGKDTVELSRGETGQILEAEWQLAELPGVDVQHDSGVMPSTSPQLNVALSPVDPKRSFLLFSSSAGPMTDGEDRTHVIRGALTGTTLRFERAAPKGQILLAWFVVQLPGGFRVRHDAKATKAPHDELALEAPLQPPVDLKRSFLLHSNTMSHTGDNFFDAAMLAAELGAKAIRFERGHADGAALSIAWSVVELPVSP